MAKTTKKNVQVTKATKNDVLVEEKKVPKKKVLIIASEGSPFIRTGGLGDVVGALPKSLAANGVDVRVVMPLYKSIPDKYKNVMKFQGYLYVSLAWRYQYCGVFKYQDEGVIYYFIDNEYYFKRDGIYGHFDDAERFAFFSKAAIEMLATVDFRPDIIHANDWHTAMVPVYLDSLYRDHEFYRYIKTVFTIHNIQFQGKYGIDLIQEVLGLPQDKVSLVEYQSCVNFMKGAIETSNAVTTVSPTYAKEIFNPFFSYGLDGILIDRGYKVSGIVNGIDLEKFNPSTDNSLFVKYDVNTIKEGKSKNKKELVSMLNLMPVTDSTAVIGMVTRLTDQKGVDLVIYAMEALMKRDIRLVVLGKGDWKYENALLCLQEQYGEKLRVIIDFSDDLANKIYGGSDMFLMPSKFEPCGLSQLISMRYGTIPVVRKIGGLQDTVEAYNPITKKGDGFNFYDYDVNELLGAVDRALTVFANKDEWYDLVKHDMLKDSSWDQSAQKYIDLYNKI